MYKLFIITKAIHNRQSKKIILLILILFFMVFNIINLFPLFHNKFVNILQLNIEKEIVNNYKINNNTHAKKIAILVYHRIVKDYIKKKKYLNNRYIISISEFKKHMKWLYKKGYKTLNCEEFYLWFQGKLNFPKKTLLITFDDGTIGHSKYSMPILKKYNMKGIFFIIGKNTFKDNKELINYKSLNELRKKYSNVDFQSHTFDLHILKKFYNKTFEECKNEIFKDILLQSIIFNFTKFLAYPYGYATTEMIKIYKNSSIKMAFLFGSYKLSTKKDNIYGISRIPINGNEDFSYFTRWFID